MSTNNTSTSNNSRVSDAGCAAYNAAASYYGDHKGATWEAAEAAFAAFDRVCSEERRALDARRPDGKLPKGHPWTGELADLGEWIKTNRALVDAMYYRAKAKRLGRLDRYDTIRDADFGRVASAADCERGASIPSTMGPREAFDLAVR
jgi:hypothetical protein